METPNKRGPAGHDGAPTPTTGATRTLLDYYHSESALARQRHEQTVERLILEGRLQDKRFRRRFAALAAVAVALFAVTATMAFPWGGEEWTPNEGVAFLEWQREHGSSGARFARNNPELAATFKGNWPEDHAARLKAANLKNCQAAACAKDVIRAVFPDNSEDYAIRIAACETGNTFNPRASGDGGNSIGLFQVNHVWWDLPWVGGPERLVNPWHNARVALRISGGGTNWEPWTCHRLISS